MSAVLGVGPASRSCVVCPSRSRRGTLYFLPPLQVLGLVWDVKVEKHNAASSTSQRHLWAGCVQS